MEARVCGIPCQVEILSARYHRPQSLNPYNCDSDKDYYGYWGEIDYQLYDRRGYRAKWLENKMSSKDHDELIEFITENLDTGDY